MLCLLYLKYYFNFIPAFLCPQRNAGQRNSPTLKCTRTSIVKFILKQANSLELMLSNITKCVYTRSDNACFVIDSLTLMARSVRVGKSCLCAPNEMSQ